MTEHKTFPGKTYVVTSKAGCDITDASGELEETCEPGKQKVINAPSDILYTSAPAVVRETFNSAPAKLRLLGLLGGGESASGGSALPAGYLAAEFLENNRSSFFKTDIICSENTAFECLFMSNSTVNAALFGTEPKDGSDFCVWMPSATQVWLRIGNESRTVNTPNNKGVKVKWRFSKDGIERDGVLIQAYSTAPACTSPAYIFTANYNIAYAIKGKLYNAAFSESNKKIFDAVMAIDNNGIPCMFDKVTKQPCYAGAGLFIVGMTSKQALKLADLPATGGTLTVSLPSSIVSNNTVIDTSVDAAIKTAKANGWQITVQTYTEEANTASTFGLRRIWVRKTQDDNGSYVDADGVRYAVDWCVAMYTPDGSEPDAHGYELYRSVDAAVAYWELEPWVDPEQEELLTAYNENE